MSDERLIRQRLADEFLAVDPKGLRWAEGTVHGLVHDAFKAGRDYERDEARREADEARELLRRVDDVGSLPVHLEMNVREFLKRTRKHGREP